GQPRIVDQHRPGADEHDIAQRTLSMGVEARLRPAHPSRRAVGSRRAAVERRRELPGDVRTAVVLRESPRAAEGGCVGGEHTALASHPSALTGGVPTAADTDVTAAAACILPSGLSPSVPEFRRIGRPLAAAGSRTVTAGSEFHRPRSTRALTRAAILPRRLSG